MDRIPARDSFLHHLNLNISLILPFGWLPAAIYTVFRCFMLAILTFLCIHISILCGGGRGTCVFDVSAPHPAVLQPAISVGRTPGHCMFHASLPRQRRLSGGHFLSGCVGALQPIKIPVATLFLHLSEKAPTTVGQKILKKMFYWYFLPSSRFLSPLKGFKQPYFQETRSLFSVNRPLFHHAVSLIYSHPSPNKHLAADPAHESWIHSVCCNVW